MNLLLILLVIILIIEIVILIYLAGMNGFNVEKYDNIKVRLIRIERKLSKKEK